MRNKFCILPVILSVFLFTCCSSSNSNNSGESPGENKKEQFTMRYLSDQSFYSKILEEEVKYEVLLPQEYLSETTSSFGVVYLLHGWGDNQTSWGPTGLNIQSIADEQQNAGKLRPLIYVIPQGFNSYYCNQYDGKFNYMNMFVEELMPLVEKRFRTTAIRNERAIVGYSMGGFGAITMASQHTDLFSVGVGLSPSLNNDEQYTTLSQDGWNIQWGNIFGGYGSIGPSRLTSYYKSQCPLHFFQDKAASLFQSMNYYITCGDDEERLYIGNGELHSLMRKQGINHEYRVENGAHTSSYWITAMKEALPFIEYSFKGVAYPQETTKRFSETMHSNSKIVQINNSNIEIWLPTDYDPSNTYKVLYYCKGKGGIDLTTKQVALALDSLIENKRLVVVGFDGTEMLQNGINFSAIINTVETNVNTDKKATSRIGLLYGSNGEYLFNNTLGDNPLLSYLFVEDGNIDYSVNQPNANLYYLDITDGGSNYDSMLKIFEHLRNQNSNVQYRVRNGLDTVNSAQTGIYSMSYFIGEQLIKK